MSLPIIVDSFLVAVGNILLGVLLVFFGILEPRPASRLSIGQVP